MFSFKPRGTDTLEINGGSTRTGRSIQATLATRNGWKYLMLLWNIERGIENPTERQILGHSISVRIVKFSHTKTLVVHNTTENHLPLLFSQTYLFGHTKKCFQVTDWKISSSHSTLIPYEYSWTSKTLLLELIVVVSNIYLENQPWSHFAPAQPSRHTLFPLESQE